MGSVTLKGEEEQVGKLGGLISGARITQEAENRRWSPWTQVRAWTMVDRRMVWSKPRNERERRVEASCHLSYPLQRWGQTLTLKVRAIRRRKVLVVGGGTKRSQRLQQPRDRR